MHASTNSVETPNHTGLSNSTLRVLFISHTYVVGVNQGKLNAIAEIDGVTVGLLAPSNWKANEWNRLIPVERPYPKIQIYTLPVAFSGRGGAYCFNPLSMIQVLNDFRPDIVQVEEEIFSVLTLQVALWAKIRKIPMVVFGWENMERQLPMPRQWLRAIVMASTQLFIAGNTDGSNLMRQWGYQKPIEVMPQMGVDTELFSPKLVKPSDDGVFRIGFLGRLSPGKGIDLILSALRQLRSQDLACKVILCGTGPSEEKLRNQAQELQIADWIVWRGGVRHEEAPMEIGNFDVLVLPSRSTPKWKEQFGHVLIEAMSMSIPVVGSSSGEIPNVIGRPDLVFQEEDTDGLTAILARMIQEPEWWQEVSQYCFNRVQEHYSHQHIAERLFNLWQGLTSKIH
jgi:hypothetical protein